MNNGLLVLFIAVSFNYNMSGQKADSTGQNLNGCSLITTFKNERTEYKFASLEDLNANLEAIINEVEYNVQEKTKEECELIMELKFGIVQNGVTNITSKKITANCVQENINLAINKLKAEIFAAIDKETVCQMSK